VKREGVTRTELIGQDLKFQKVTTEEGGGYPSVFKENATTGGKERRSYPAIYGRTASKQLKKRGGKGPRVASDRGGWSW